MVLHLIHFLYFLLLCSGGPLVYTPPGGPTHKYLIGSVDIFMPINYLSLDNKLVIARRHHVWWRVQL